ncbi:hypothetical protein Q5P01_021623 [Channa striata]|uniref:Uncharacterized protein n=1 Tax=Channa striata TaxID=64152 RepID=A0AA88LV00_CHASR|nr:hypothetical protein Q5P01_021623 [Channa striata]
MMWHIRFLKNEVERLKKSLRTTELQHTEKRAQYIEEERHMREENIRLQRKLQREMERREAESESSLEMDDESISVIASKKNCVQPRSLHPSSSSS